VNVVLGRPQIAEVSMRRFYFGLQGKQNVDDRYGMLFQDDLQAFRAGQRLATELSQVRPNLHGNTCVVIAPKGVDYHYCVSI
jgi:hypothetical protein